MLREFFENLGYKPNNLRLYEEAVTHNSFSNENKLKYNYQRLEFLGDAILQHITSLELYNTYKTVKEGDLSLQRSGWVRKETLADVAKEIGLHTIVRLGNGEHNKKGYENQKMLSDLYEAVLAAIYLDHGFEAAYKFVKESLLTQEKIENITPDISGKDAKTRLQELIQAEMRCDLSYKTLREWAEGSEHFTESAVMLDDMKFGVGIAKNKKLAEQAAAVNALSKLAAATEEKK